MPVSKNWGHMVFQLANAFKIGHILWMDSDIWLSHFTSYLLNPPHSAWSIRDEIKRSMSGKKK
jgi:hypothetical protein